MYESLTKYIGEVKNPGQWIVDNANGEIIHLPYVSFRGEIHGFISEAANLTAVKKVCI